ELEDHRRRDERADGRRREVERALELVDRLDGRHRARERRRERDDRERVDPDADELLGEVPVVEPDVADLPEGARHQEPEPAEAGEGVLRPAKQKGDHAVSHGEGILGRRPAGAGPPRAKILAPADPTPSPPPHPPEFYRFPSAHRAAPWRNPRPSSPARAAATSPTAGWGSAPSARPGTRSSRRPSAPPSR